MSETRIVYRCIFFLCPALFAVLVLGAQTALPATPLSLPAEKNYDEEAKSWYAMFSRDSNVYVYLAATDALQQRKMAMNGVELWIDTHGKKTKKTGISFPFSAFPASQGATPAFDPGLPGDNEREQPGGGNAGRIASLEKIIAQNREMKLTGFKEELNGIQNHHHPSGINVSMYFSGDTLVYLAQLPINTFSELPSVHSCLAVGLVERGMAMPIDNGMPPPSGGGDGIVPPPPGPTPGEGMGMRIFEDNIIWYRFLLQ